MILFIYNKYNIVFDGAVMNYVILKKDLRDEEIRKCPILQKMESNLK